MIDEVADVVTVIMIAIPMLAAVRSTNWFGYQESFFKIDLLS